MQLKGAGPTPYSRTADGLAVLRSSLREFVCSEAMFHLGVPTTRALSLTLTGEEVVRDILYDGHPAPEPGAVVCRIAPSFTRFGHFEMLAARNNLQLLRHFLDFTISTDFPELAQEEDPQRRYLAWFAEVTERTADMIAHWMRVGFVHGVMNTDNMSALGLTIDYGPYGWLEDYDPDWTPNTTDAATRRYRFGQQPAAAQWNLLQLAQAIHPLIGEAEPLNAILKDFATRYTRQSETANAAKLGLPSYVASSDQPLFDELFALLGSVETDMTLFFRDLAHVDLDAVSIEPLLDAYYAPASLTPALRERTEAWLGRYAERVRSVGEPDAARIQRMNAVNPRFVPRNYLAQQAIDQAEQGDFGLLHEWMAVLRRPYDEQPGKEQFAAKRPEWARHRAGCSMLSCKLVNVRGVVSLAGLLALTLGPAAIQAAAQQDAAQPAAATPMQGMIDAIQADARRTAEYSGIERIGDAVVAALRKTPREAFVPARSQSLAYANHPLPIGHGQDHFTAVHRRRDDRSAGRSATPPRARNRHRLRLPSRSAGHLASAVYSVEIVPELAASAAERLAELGYDNVHVRASDGWRGWPEQAPFDGVIVTAVGREIPPALIEQLADDGRLVMPLGEPDGYQELVTYHKRSGEMERLFSVRFVPLTGGP